jgi:hypothetical protein
MGKNVPSIDSIKRFTDQCFDTDTEKAAEIIMGILKGQSPRRYIQMKGDEDRLA